MGIEIKLFWSSIPFEGLNHHSSRVEKKGNYIHWEVHLCSLEQEGTTLGFIHGHWPDLKLHMYVIKRLFLQ